MNPGGPQLLWRLLVSILALALLAFPQIRSPGSLSQTPRPVPEEHLLRGSPNLNAAVAAEKAGRYEEAIRRYEHFLATAGTAWPRRSALILFARAHLASSYYLVHRYQDSLNVLLPGSGNNRVFPRAGLSPHATLLVGLDYLELNQLPDAVAWLRRALAVDPASGTARLALGDAFARQGEFLEAARLYREQTRRTPREADAWYKLGLSYSALAGQMSSQLIRAPQGDPPAPELTAELHLASGDYWGMVRTLLPRRKMHTEEPELHALLGRALLELGYVRAAETEFDRELSQNPFSPPASLGRAETDAFEGRWESALSRLERVAHFDPHELERLLQFPPSHPTGQAWREGRITIPVALSGSLGGRLWTFWLNQQRPAPSLAGAMGDQCPSIPDALMRPGFCLSETCYRRLLAQFRTGRTLGRREKLKQIEAEWRLGQYNSSSTHAQQFLQSWPNEPWGLYWLAKSFESLASRSLVKVTQLNPNSPRVRQVLAQYYADRLHDFPRAIEEYQAALRLSPDLPDLHMRLGTLYWQAGNWEKAATELRRTLEVSPGSIQASYELGDTYIQQRRWEAAIPLLQRVLANPAVEFKARLDLAKAEAALGHTRQAIEALVARAEGDQDGELHYRLAALYRKIGENEKAAQALETSERLRAAANRLDQEQLKALEREREEVEGLGKQGQ